MGSLRQSLQAGLLHHRLVTPEGAPVVAVDLPALLDVALEVAEAVDYLHSIRLAHCDIKVRVWLCVGAGVGRHLASFVALASSLSAAPLLHLPPSPPCLPGAPRAEDLAQPSPPPRGPPHSTSQLPPPTPLSPLSNPP